MGSLFRLVQELHAQLKKCDRLPPPWDAYQTDDPVGHHDLAKRLRSALRISSLGPSRHMVRSNDGDERQEFFPDRTWNIRVMPSFHGHGLVAVFEGRSQVRCAIVCRGDLPDRPDADYVVVDHFCDAEEWDDPVLPIVQSIDLAPTPDRRGPDGISMSTLDGISYSFCIETDELHCSIRFSNPRFGVYRKLERACYNAATRISKHIDDPQMSNFIKTWKSYTRD